MAYRPECVCVPKVLELHHSVAPGALHRCHELPRQSVKLLLGSPGTPVPRSIMGDYSETGSGRTTVIYGRSSYQSNKASQRWQ